MVAFDLLSQEFITNYKIMAGIQPAMRLTGLLFGLF